MPGGSGPGFKSRGAMEVPWAVLAFSTPPIRTFCWRGKTTFHLSAHTVRRRRRWQSIFWGANFNNRNAYGLVRKWMLLLLGPDRRWDHGLMDSSKRQSSSSCMLGTFVSLLDPAWAWTTGATCIHLMDAIPRCIFWFSVFRELQQHIFIGNSSARQPSSRQTLRLRRYLGIFGDLTHLLVALVLSAGI